MKITTREKALLIAFAGFVGTSLGLPIATSASTMRYLVDRFEKYFNDREADARKLIDDYAEAHG